MEVQAEHPQKKRKVKFVDESQSQKVAKLVGVGKAAKDKSRDQPVGESEEDGGAPSKKIKKCV